MTILIAALLFVRNVFGLQPYLVELVKETVKIWVLVQYVHARIFPLFLF